MVDWNFVINAIIVIGILVFSGWATWVAFKEGLTFALIGAIFLLLILFDRFSTGSWYVSLGDEQLSCLSSVLDSGNSNISDIG